MIDFIARAAGLVVVTICVMFLCLCGFFLTPFAVLYLVFVEWREVDDDDSDEEMFNVR